MRPSKRALNEPRTIEFLTHFTQHAEGSVLSCFGDTKVLCTASIEERVPPFLRGKAQGWITAEYGMLPRSTHTRSQREAARGKQTGRTQEIQRLIGRSLRAAVNLEALGERTITFDCDVLQADGGTRTAAISGSFVALSLAVRQLMDQGVLTSNPIISQIAAVSVGIYQGQAVTDLDYLEDSAAETDMNVVMNDARQFIEIQATAEESAFSDEHLMQMLALARSSITMIMQKQKEALGTAFPLI